MTHHKQITKSGAKLNNGRKQKMKNLTIEQLAEKLGGKLWIKGDLKRIYLDRGYNTKKMSTKTYVYQREDGTFGVKCSIDCPSQAFQWIESQENEVVESVKLSIERATWLFNNPDGDYDQHCEEVAEMIEKEAEQKELSAKEIEKKKIAELTIGNVWEYLEQKGWDFRNSTESIKKINYAHFQLKSEVNFLNVKDDYAPLITSYMIVLPKAGQGSSDNFFSKLPTIHVGTQYFNFDVLLEWKKVGEQGNNSRRKNQFMPVSVPQEITDKLNAVLVEEQAKRIEELKERVAKYTIELQASIDAYKQENNG